MHGVHHIGTNAAEVVPDAEADHWSIYGKLGGLYTCVGDFSSREAAELIVDLLNKNPGLPS